MVKTKGGDLPDFEAVELNPNTKFGISGYIATNPLVHDAYLSALKGEVPQHAKEGKELLKSASAVPLENLAPPIKSRKLPLEGFSLTA